MTRLFGFVIALTITVFAVTYISISHQTKESALKSELTVTNALESFLDIVADKGAVTSKDYTTLLNQLNSTGATYEVTISVSRLLPTPSDAEPGSYEMEYFPAYGWKSSQGGLTADYVDPNWAGRNAAPKGTQYLNKGDNVQLVLKQTSLMNYQRTMVTRLNQGTTLGDWSYAKSVRNSGTSITEQQQAPM